MAASFVDHFTPSGEAKRALYVTAGVGLSIVTVASFWGAQHLLGSGNAIGAFYWMPPRAWELGLGATLGIAALALPAETVPRRWAGTLYSASTPFPGLSALLPVTGSALILAAGTWGTPNAISRLLATRPLIRIGLVSYGWYLWHWPLLAALRIHGLGEVPSLAATLTALSASLPSLRLDLDYRSGKTNTSCFMNAEDLTNSSCNSCMARTFS